MKTIASSYIVPAEVYRTNVGRDNERLATLLTNEGIPPLQDRDADGINTSAFIIAGIDGNINMYEGLDAITVLRALYAQRDETSKINYMSTLIVVSAKQERRARTIMNKVSKLLLLLGHTLISEIESS